jgi:hypothetical protein
MKTQSASPTQATSSFPKTIPARGVPGITATIYRQKRKKVDKAGVAKTYQAYLVSYTTCSKKIITLAVRTTRKAKKVQPAEADPAVAAT